MTRVRSRPVFVGARRRRQRDRLRHKDGDRETQRQTERQADRQTETEGQRQRDRERDRDREREETDSVHPEHIELLSFSHNFVVFTFFLTQLALTDIGSGLVSVSA